MDQDSVVKQIKKINNSSTGHGKTGPAQIRTSSQARRVERISPNRPGSGNKRDNSYYRPNESRIAVSGSRNYRKSNSRRKSVYKRKRKTSWRTYFAIVMAVIVLCGGLGGGIYAIWYNSYTDVKLADCSVASFSGYNGYGSATLNMNVDNIYSDFWDSVTATMSSDSNLTNGDDITVTYTYDKEIAKSCRLRIDDTPDQIKVEGLSESTVIDHNSLFGNLQVNFDGLSPCVEPLLENTSTDEFLSTVTYSLVGEKRFFESGDEVQVVAQIDDSMLMDHKYTLNLSESDYYNTYTVPEGDSYFTTASQVSDDILNQLEKAGLEMISRADAKEYGLRIFQQEAHLQPVFVGNTTTFKWVNPYVMSAYFHNVTPAGKEIPESHANDVQIVYGVTLTQQDGQSVKAEMVIQFVNLIQCADGTVDLNLDSGRIVSASYRNSNIKKLVAGDDGMYNTTKLTE